MRCEELHELAADVAFGIADGKERAAALGHLEGCAECRRLIESLSEVTDELLLLAPEQEPPLGFESRLLERLRSRPAPRRRRARGIALRVGPAAAAAAIAATIAVAVMVAAYSDDREIASGYLETLELADGEYFTARPVLDPSGAEAGIVFGYEGSPSWILVIVDPAHRDQVSAAELLTRDGDAIGLRDFRLDREQGSWGSAIPIDFHEIASVRLLGDRPGEVLETAVPQDDG